MYSDSGMASSSASVRSRPALLFQALASLGSALWAGLGVSSPRLFICRVGGRGGANRSANREVAGGSGAATGAGGGILPEREALGGGAALTTGAGAGADAGAFAGAVLAGVAALATGALVATTGL